LAKSVHVSTLNYMTHSHNHADNNQSALAEILDLDAEVLAEHTASLVSWLPVTRSPGRIVDLGCGTGTGTFALLARFPDAHVTAVDHSAELLHRLQHRAREAGLAEHVDIVVADLDADWPALCNADLVWASASLHHLSDPAAVLRRIRDLLTPDGLLVVVEPDGFPRFLPDHAPENRPGLENRCHEANDHLHGKRLPHRGTDFGVKLVAAGFSVTGERTINATIDHASAEIVGRYALTGLGRIRDTVADALSAEDLAALEQLLDPSSPSSLLRRGDLALRTKRTVWAAHLRSQGPV
jgi:SAM-dependent methyltransferase